MRGTPTIGGVPVACKQPVPRARLALGACMPRRRRIAGDQGQPVAVMAAAGQSRPALRRQLRRARRALDGRAQRRAAMQVARRLLRISAWQRARHVGAYVANDGELDPAPLLAAIGARIYVPDLRGARRGSGMHFVWRMDGRRVQAPRRRRAAWQLDVVLVPLVAFDRAGGRLGRGGGHYDRALAPRPGRPRPLLVGLAHALQEVDGLDLQPWDVRVDVIATAAALIDAAGAGRWRRLPRRRRRPRLPSA